ncbi:hypothetical protein [Aeromicrobium sp. UC242_57]|uniref:hypothetical protein n=1 Tax=Aeromicrobium sp. UC242_57 TaxID=3374624 RepID=UPI0037B17C80
MGRILQRAESLRRAVLAKTPVHELCRKCGHRKDEHRGSCRACMREERVGGGDRSDAPCSRFGRTS